jgi:hypothetical protein
MVAGLDWNYDGGTITSLGGDLYRYEGGWSGSVPVPPSSVVHFGKYFEEYCNNVFAELTGWWTDENGQKIEPAAGGTFGNNPPLVGFEVQDRILDQPPTLPQTVTFSNGTGEPLNARSIQFAISPDVIPIEQLRANSAVLDSLQWVTWSGNLELDTGQTQTVDLNAAGVAIPPSQFLVIREEVLDPTNGEYYFSAHIHGAHVPEPHEYAMLAGLGLLGFGLWRRLRS